jgi:hypothetical protein
MIDTRASNCRLCFKTIDASSPLGIELLLRLLDDSFAQKPPAMPADVRKAFGLPQTGLSILGYAQFLGAKPQIHCGPDRKRGALPHIRRQSRWRDHF